MSLSKRWCFTINNPSQEDEVNVKAWDTLYLVYGRETGESGTPHLQGFCTFKSPKRPGAVKKLHAKAHWEIAKGTSLQASEYCKKDGDYVEVGTPPTPGKRSDLLAVCEQIKDGSSLRSVAEQFPDTYVRNYRGLANFQALLTSDYNHDDVRGIWYWGPPGTGKSRKAREDHPNAYLKPQNKWFDSYAGEETIILDDLDKGGACLGHYLKIWGDRYACSGEIKGGTVKLRHKYFIVTSNYSIEQLWGEDPEMCSAITRRFSVSYFPDFKESNATMLQLVKPRKIRKLE